jgi:hypothetical protein
MSFADRDIFNLVRDTMGFSIGSYTASRATPQTVIPMGIPLVAGGRFRGMCSLGISLRAFSELVSQRVRTKATAVVWSIVGGDDRWQRRMAPSLPVPRRIAAAAPLQNRCSLTGRTDRSGSSPATSGQRRSLRSRSGSVDCGFFSLAGRLGPARDDRVGVAPRARHGVVADRWCCVRSATSRIRRPWPGQEVKLFRRPWAPEMTAVAERQADG